MFSANTMASKRDRGDELAADSVHTLRHVKRLQVQVEKDISEKRLTPKELGYEDASPRNFERFVCVAY